MCFSWLTLTDLREVDQTEAFRGSKSRNKVSVGEPAEGSLSVSLTSLSDKLVKTSGRGWLTPACSSGQGLPALDLTRFAPGD